MNDVQFKTGRENTNTQQELNIKLKCQQRTEKGLLKVANNLFRTNKIFVWENIKRTYCTFLVCSASCPRSSKLDANNTNVEHKSVSIFVSS